MNRHKDQHVACGMYMNGRRGPWEAYERNLPPEIHSPGERNTQHIERKHLTLRARIKRLVRETICFSKSIAMHDIVVGLFIHRYEFGVPV